MKSNSIQEVENKKKQDNHTVQDVQEDDDSDENSIKLAEKRIKNNKKTQLEQRVHKFDFS